MATIEDIEKIFKLQDIKQLTNNLQVTFTGSMDSAEIVFMIS